MIDFSYHDSKPRSCPCCQCFMLFVLPIDTHMLSVSLNFFPAGDVKNGTMQWEPIVYRNTTTLGSRYSYYSKHGTLRTEKGGTYFMYTQLNLTCTWKCGSGYLRVTFEDNQRNEHLSCTLHLPNTTSIPVVEKCWTVIHHLEPESRLIAKMHATAPPRGWSLDLNHSGFGMFLVDGPKTE